MDLNKKFLFGIKILSKGKIGNVQRHLYESYANSMRIGLA